MRISLIINGDTASKNKQILRTETLNSERELVWAWQERNLTGELACYTNWISLRYDRHQLNPVNL